MERVAESRNDRRSEDAMKYPNAFIAEMVLQAGRKKIPETQIIQMFREGWTKDAIKDYIAKGGKAQHGA